jgi:NTP pyrophosphatase (non-canonical NTP hydrolase)
MKSIRDLLTEEMDRALAEYPDHFHSPHEGISVIKEEYEELWDEIKKKPAKRSKKRMREEAVQLAAMAIRFIADLCPGRDGKYEW